jgi:FtsH-binding integral membrane protein
MAEIDNRYAQVGAGSRTDVAVDEGLRAYMLRVYNYMAAGIALTGVVAYVIFMYSVTSDPALAFQAGGRVFQLKRDLYLTQLGHTLFVSPLKWVIMFAPLGFALFLGFRIYQMSVAVAQIAFWLFAAVVGASLSVIFLIYTTTSIAQVFFITAASFGALSLYGYTTKKDLSGWGSFLIMGMWGVIIAGILNLFIQSNMMQFIIASVGVLVFAGLTAYDTQQIKDNYYAVMGDATAVAKGAIMGALNLYLDFINLFISLIQLLGNRE